MKDVATAADVSLKTASRVENAEPGVTEGLATRVREAIDSLGYQPDLRARELRGQKQAPATIGFIQTTSSNPFFSQIRSALEEAAAERGCLILSGSSGAQAARQEALIEALAGRRVDGLRPIICSMGAIGASPFSAAAPTFCRPSNGSTVSSRPSQIVWEQTLLAPRQQRSPMSTRQTLRPRSQNFLRSHRTDGRPPSSADRIS